MTLFQEDLAPLDRPRERWIDEASGRVETADGATPGATQLFDEAETSQVGGVPLSVV